MGWLDILFPPALAEAQIRSLPGGRTVSVHFILKTLAIAKRNVFTETGVPGLNGTPLQFVRGGARTLTTVLVFDGRATNTDVRQPMKRVTELMNIDPTRHAPPVLSFEWSGGSLQCILESAAEEFPSLFSDGRPSRGRLHVVFTESLTVEQLQQEASQQ